MTGLLVGGVMPEVVCSPRMTCRECDDTGLVYIKLPGWAPKWEPCTECRVCSACERRHLTDDPCTCEDEMTDHDYLTTLRDILTEREAEIANPVGLTDEARAALVRERDTLLAFLQREEGFDAID